MSEDSAEPEDMLFVDVPEEAQDERLDKFLASMCPDLSRSRLKALILDGEVLIGGQKITLPKYKVQAGEEIEINLPEAVDDTPQPQNIPLDIVYEDDDLLVINKQAGLVVHPGAGNWDGTLVNALLYHCGDTLSGIGGVKRPGIVHRLDKETSGLMVVAKSDRAHKGLSGQLSDRTLGRYYATLVWGVPQPLKGRVEQPIARHHVNRLKMTVNQKYGRSAATNFHVQENYGDAVSLVECKLESGRTHQIRVHMNFIKHPVLGDPLYGIQDTGALSLLRKNGFEKEVVDKVMAFPRQALHAQKIHFIHPVKNTEMSFESDLPEDMAEIIAVLNQ